MMKVVLVLLLLGALVTVNVTGCVPDYSDGQRVGYVNKFSKKGVIFKSWEGRMQVGGLTGGEGGTFSTEIWDFSVTDPAIAAELEAKLGDGKRVALTYSQWLLSPRTQDTNYTITNVE